MKKTIKTLFCALIAALAFTACEDVPAPEGGYTLPGNNGGNQPTAKEVTCAEAAEIVANLADGETTAETYCITGYITDVYTTISKNQQSFWISDNNDGQKIIQAYWANLPEGVSAFTKGAKVKITGKLMKFVNTSGTVVPEVKNADVEILDGDDTPSDAITATCAEAATIANGLADGATSAETYSVTGYITDVFATVSKGQQSFWMADTKDGGKVLQAYWANLPAGVEAFTKGMKVTITGQIMKYVKDGNVTPEIKNADVKILEAGEGGGGNDPIEGTPAGTGTEADPYNVAAALNYIQTLASGEKPATLVYTKGVISEVVKMGTSGSIQFKMQDKNVANSLLVYYCDNLGKNPFKALTDLKVGDEVIVCGTVQNYQGNTPEYNSGAYLVSLNGKTEYEGGDDNSDDNVPTGDAANFSIDLPYTLGANAYDNGAATINGASVEKTIKIGTSSKAGDFNLTVPAGKLTFYAITWKGAGTADVKVGDQTITVKANEGAVGNAPYTITVTEADKYEIDIPAATTLNISSDKRIIFFGIKMK